MRIERLWLIMRLAECEAVYRTGRSQEELALLADIWAQDLEEQDILDRSDVKQWYTQKGIALLSALIDELNVQGHKRLTIKENGDVFVTASGKQQPVDTIPDFPPRPAWEDLCVLAREDDIAAEVCNQELTVSWA